MVDAQDTATRQNVRSVLTCTNGNETLQKCVNRRLVNSGIC